MPQMRGEPTAASASDTSALYRQSLVGTSEAAIGSHGLSDWLMTRYLGRAVDPLAIPHGAVVWLDTTEPLSNTPLRRLVMAQDSGSAITGAVRADLFFGWTRQAETLAGRMKQPLRLWVLWPRGD